VIDQRQIINLAIKSGVIDSADINSIHISQAYIDDLSEFAYLVQQVERAETLKWLHLFQSNLVEAGNQHGPHVVGLVIKMLEDLNDSAT
jgi:hypothetical protein